MSQTGSFLTARWEHLVMLNYELPPAVLAPFVPAGTELDEFGGKCFISLVGFQFRETRLLGLPIPWHRHFDEINLRFYVRRDDQHGRRRGVVFIREIVPRAAIAWVARLVYNEAYVALPMHHVDEIGQRPEPLVAYHWRHGGRDHHFGVRVSGAPELPAETSEESFITEHYWGFVRQRSGRTLAYEVEHPRWRVWRATETIVMADLAAQYGATLAAFLQGPPSSAMLAEGSAITVRRGQLIPAP